MGIIDFFRKQFIDIIQWTEDADGILAYRYPMMDMEIQNGATLVVRDTQKAMLVDQGRMADLFGPGQYTLKTANLPILTNLKNWDKFFESPFKSDVYFFSTRLQIDQKWGTANPITIRDKEFGAIRLRAHGIYAYRLEDPTRFYTEVSGTRDLYTVGDLEGQLRGTLLTTLTDLFAESQIPFLDMAANQLEFSARIGAALEPSFRRLGVKLDSFLVQNLSLPEALQAKFDERVSMNIVGDLGKYTQYQSAQSIPIAAGNEGGGAGAGIALGAGISMGQTMAAAMGAANKDQSADAKESPLDTIERLHQLVQKGALTQEEFQAKKAELLKKVTG
jgi:membrane protease subunit (stomatin/prohibitin family)